MTTNMPTIILRRNTDIEKARQKCIKKFLYYFPGGYQGKKYIEWERDYKWAAHIAWQEQLNRSVFKELLVQADYGEIAKRAVKIESKTNLLFSFEKMALRDAVNTSPSARLFAEGLFHFIYGGAPLPRRFESYRDTLSMLPVKQTRVLTWPVLTVFGFIADPSMHIYLKPTVTKLAARKYKFDLQYSSKPSWEVYQSLLSFAEQIRRDTAKWKPRDMIDIQSFIWVMGSSEYP
jgi:hypothetical protein